LQALILLLLYTFVYVIIQLEDFALLMGSIGIFVILAIVMFISKKIDWYGEKGEN
jgi:inner membrane protein